MQFLLALFIIFTSTSTIKAQTISSSFSPSINAQVITNKGSAKEKDTTAPTIPILLRPIDGTHTNNPHPEFAWLTSNDPNSNYVSYDLYLNGTATYLGINNYGNSLTHNYQARLENGSLHLLPLSSLNDGVYDWFVVAYDLSGNERKSAQWRLIFYN